jgi:putative transposase
MVISDGHKGIRGAVERCFLGASWQMCQVRFIRNLMKVIPKKSWCDVVDAIQLALSDPSRLGDARALLERKGMTKAIDLFDRFQDSLHSYSAFPRQQWKRLRTSNMLERINGGHATPERFPTTGRCSVLQWPF